MIERLDTNTSFASLLDDDTVATINDGAEQLEDGKAQLVTQSYSRIIITTSYAEESDETSEFVNWLMDYSDENFSGSTYLIGNSIMVEEMKDAFSGEFRMISLLTALAIFLIEALTFRSLVIPLALVLLVQTGVNITASIIGVTSGGMYYLALLIVECILMGSTIDYGILYVSNYREARRECGILPSLRRAYDRSMGTILTSGIILVVVVGVLQFMFEEAAVRAIVRTLSLGGFSVLILIIFVLPGILAALDRFVVKKGTAVPADTPDPAESAENAEAVED